MSARPPGKHAFVFIFITVLIDMIGFGIIIPVMPQFVMELTGQPIESAAVMGGLLMGVFAFTQFIFAPARNPEPPEPPAVQYPARQPVRVALADAPVSSRFCHVDGGISLLPGACGLPGIVDLFLDFAL